MREQDARNTPRDFGAAAAGIALNVTRRSRGAAGYLWELSELSGMTVIQARDVEAMGIAAIAQKALAVGGDMPTYLSFAAMSHCCDGGHVPQAAQMELPLHGDVEHTAEFRRRRPVEQSPMSRLEADNRILVRFGFEIVIECPSPVTMLLALLPNAEFQGRLLGSDGIRTEPHIALEKYRDRFGNRMTRVVVPAGATRLWSDCIAEVDGAPDDVVPHAAQAAVKDLPVETLEFIVASRYCESDALGEMAWQLFGGTPPGWSRVQSICDFVHERVTFGYEFGRATKTAREVYEERNGVCRDFAHLGVALCRAMNIPARYVSGYLGDIGVPAAGPGDFCAWFEAFLNNRWYTFDPRYNTPRIGRIPMVRGRDAADVPMITSFGAHSLTGFRVWTDQVEDAPTHTRLRELLATRPETPSLIAHAGQTTF